MEILDAADIERWRRSGDDPLSPGAVSLPAPPSWEEGFPTTPPSWPGSSSRSGQTDPAAFLRENFGVHPLRGAMRRAPPENASLSTLLLSEQASPRQVPLPPSSSEQPNQEGGATRMRAASLERARIMERPLRTGGQSRSV
jgi:hypothetical protein